MKPANVHKVGKLEVLTVTVSEFKDDEKLIQILKMGREQYEQVFRCGSGEHEAFEEFAKDQTSAICKHCRCLFVEVK